jgi:hypothetical protein
MSLTGLIPTDISINIAIAICAIAFVSGTARGFSGFGSALIFMPLASSLVLPRRAWSRPSCSSSTSSPPRRWFRMRGSKRTARQPLSWWQAP